MPEQNNDFINWELENTAKKKRDNTNRHLKEKYAMQNFRHDLKSRTDGTIEEYYKPMQEYQSPIAEVIDGDLRTRVLGQIKLGSKRGFTSKTTKKSFGPRVYSLSS